MKIFWSYRSGREQRYQPIHWINSCRLDFRTESRWPMCCNVEGHRYVSLSWSTVSPGGPRAFIFISMSIKHGGWEWESKWHTVNMRLCVCVFACGRTVCVLGPCQQSVPLARLLPSRRTFYNTVRDSQSNGLCAGVTQQRSGDPFSRVAAQIKAPSMKRKKKIIKGWETRRGAW